MRIKTVMLAAAAVLIGAVALASNAKALDVPSDFRCNAQGTTCIAPGINTPRDTIPFTQRDHVRFNYPNDIIVEHAEDYQVVQSGWVSRGDCTLLIGATDYPDVDFVKAKYCKLKQAGYKVRIPRIVKAW